ncbi:uncharacterized protein BHQ10_000692 [Talaromyces amestolkiae]|uniref:C2H2-type domain-containing protein n=1 Tax=Talaromyces amestolkiae TaxID=1196081 RepID=A0A364KMA3_TALAM|nr:uncharacterized protein BHQ10_000692 [Talaromyces amestolkiae]RAO64680.1 hypothetical protein BHQ10_000692 [Talaromyces amestolkiae]
MASRRVEEASTIKATKSCFEHFTHCIRELEGAQNTHIKNRCADFKLWADSVGAGAQGQASLDWRFHDRPDDIFLVQGLLGMLEEFLKECSAVLEDQKEVEKVLHKIDSIMHDLISMGVAIRRSGRKSRLHKADSSFDRDRKKYCDLQTHLAIVIVSRPSEGPRSLSESDSFADIKLSPIQNRLIEANLRRRHRFMEAQRHSNLLKSPTLGIFESPSLQEVSDILATVGADSSLEHETHPNEPALRQLLPVTAARAETLTMSGTIASAPETDFKGLQHDGHAGSTATRITAITAAARYPKAKTLGTQHFSFKCPCCCQAIPAKEAEENRFRKHLASDICPYTCIFDNCPTPYELFVTQKEWKEHFMHVHPPKFQCFYCSKAPLSSLAEIMNHIEIDHPSISDDELADALAESPIHVMGITQCPLCDSEGSPDSPDLIEHVLEHIHDFSLRSLPWPKDPVPHLNKAVGTFNIAVQNVGTIIEWAEESSPENECQLQLCGIDMKSLTEEEVAYNESQLDYFDQNDYFMEESSDGRLSSLSGQSYLSRSESQHSSIRGDDRQNASHDSAEYLHDGATIRSAEDFATRLSVIDTESASIQDQERLSRTSASRLPVFGENDSRTVLKPEYVIGQVFSNPRPKESFVRSGLSKALRFIQPPPQPPVDSMPWLVPPFDRHLTLILNIIRGVEIYIQETTRSMIQFRELASCIEGCIDVAQSSYTEMEETWYQLCVQIRDITNHDIEEFGKRIRKDVINPMRTVFNLLKGAQKVMNERERRLTDWIQFMEIKRRGDLPDKKITEKGEKFIVLNNALIVGLPKLFRLVEDLMQTCLKIFVAIQQEWYLTIHRKLCSLVADIPWDFSEVVRSWSARFGTVNAQIESLRLFENLFKQI